MSHVDTEGIIYVVDANLLHLYSQDGARKEQLLRKGTRFQVLPGEAVLNDETPAINVRVLSNSHFGLLPKEEFNSGASILTENQVLSAAKRSTVLRLIDRIRQI